MATTKLSRTIGTPTSGTKFTISAWVKGSMAEGRILTSINGNSSQTWVELQNSGAFRIANYVGSYNMQLITTRLFRDPSAWYNFVIAFDTTQVTDTNRVKLYVNGVQETSFSTTTYPSQNLVLKYGVSGQTFNVGAKDTDTYWNGLISYTAFVDGTVYTPTAFGEVDTASGIWKINTSPSVTYGNNGFFLKMDTSSPGSDTSGNDNTFTASGTPTLAQDNASNNLVTLNPLDNYWMNGTFAYGNTRVTTATTEAGYNTGTIGASSGKFYWEMKLAQPVTSGNYHVVGVASVQPFDTEGLGYREGGYAYQGYDGQIRANGSVSSYGDTWNTNDIIGTAIDVTNKKLYFSKNGVWQNSGDPTSGATGTGAFALTQDDFYFPAVSDHAGGGYTSGIFDFNFGNGFFGVTAVASSNADAAGHGLFEYAVPTGFFTLNTKNLNTYGG